MKLSLFLLISLTLSAATSICDKHYYNNFLPDNNQSYHELCYNGFAVNYDDTTKNPHWVGASITKDDIKAARTISRHCTFTPEYRLSQDLRKSTKDFTNNGYSRGHMYANGNAPTIELQQETCILTNIVPQKQIGNNGGIWKQLEDATQNLALQEEIIYEINGPIFIGIVKTIGKHKIAIPNKLFKMIYSVKQNKAVVMVIDNCENAQTTLKTYTLSEFETKYNIKLMDKNYPLLKFKY